jgi:hypothetical protein
LISSATHGKPDEKEENIPAVYNRPTRLVDSVLHPVAEKHPLVWLVDGAIHAAVEQNPEMSLKKFLKFTVLLRVEEQVAREQKSVRGERRKSPFN